MAALADAVDRMRMRIVVKRVLADTTCRFLMISAEKSRGRVRHGMYIPSVPSKRMRRGHADPKGRGMVR